MDAISAAAGFGSKYVRNPFAKRSRARPAMSISAGRIGR
jgi:hypothetical protein